MFRVKLWGARGSLPSPLLPLEIEERAADLITEFLASGHLLADPKAGNPSPEEAVKRFLGEQPWHRLGGYGGNTPCVEVAHKDLGGDSRLIIDGGSGIRLLGYELLKGPCGRGQGEVHLLFTHFHWDHLMGLPFFAPIFIPGNKVHVYAVQPDLQRVFETIFQKPYFPVPFAQLGAHFQFHTLKLREPTMLQGFMVTPYQLDHPDPCYSFRMERDGKVFSHCVDTEATRVSRSDLGPDLPLYQGVDLMTFDAQYTLTENIEKVNWGHAAAWIGLDIAMRENVKKIVFIHHDPGSSDEKIAMVEAQTKRYFESRQRQIKSTDRASEIRWCFGREGMIFDLS